MAKEKKKAGRPPKTPRREGTPDLPTEKGFADSGPPESEFVPEETGGKATITAADAGIPDAPEPTGNVEEALSAFEGDVSDPVPQRPPSEGDTEAGEEQEMLGDDPPDEDENPAFDAEDGDGNEEEAPKKRRKNAKGSYDRMARGLLKSVERALKMMNKAILSGRMSREEIANFNAENSLDQDEIEFVCEPLAEVLEENRTAIKSSDLLIAAIILVFGTRLLILATKVKELNEADAARQERMKGPAREATVEAEVVSVKDKQV